MESRKSYSLKEKAVQRVSPWLGRLPEPRDQKVLECQAAFLMCSCLCCSRSDWPEGCVPGTSLASPGFCLRMGHRTHRLRLSRSKGGWKESWLSMRSGSVQTASLTHSHLVDLLFPHLDMKGLDSVVKNPWHEVSMGFP